MPRSIIVSDQTVGFDVSLSISHLDNPFSEVLSKASDLHIRRANMDWKGSRSVSGQIVSLEVRFPASVGSLRVVCGVEGLA
jgi:hypothetical protein